MSAKHPDLSPHSRLPTASFKYRLQVDTFRPGLYSIFIIEHIGRDSDFGPVVMA